MEGTVTQWAVPSRMSQEVPGEIQRRHSSGQEAGLLVFAPLEGLAPHQWDEARRPEGFELFAGARIVFLDYLHSQMDEEQTATWFQARLQQFVTSTGHDNTRDLASHAMHVRSLEYRSSAPPTYWLVSRVPFPEKGEDEYERILRSAVQQAIEEPVLKFRLLKEGRIGFRFACIFDTEQDKWSVLTLSHFVPWVFEGFPKEFRLESSDVRAFQEIAGSLQGQRLLHFPAFWHFSNAFHEPYLMHEFLSFCYALESCLGGEGSTATIKTCKNCGTRCPGIGTRIAVRGEYLLRHFRGANGDFQGDFKQIYRERSRLAHGGNAEKWGIGGNISSENIQLVRKAGEYCRVILYGVLKDPKFRSCFLVGKLCQEIDDNLSAQ